MKSTQVHHSGTPLQKFTNVSGNRSLTRAARIGAATVRSREKIGSISRLTDESVCPTLMRKRLRFGGAGASACQPIFSQLLSSTLSNDRARSSADTAPIRGFGYFFISDTGCDITKTLDHS